MQNRRNSNIVSIIIFFNLFLLFRIVEANASDEYRVQDAYASSSAYVASPISYVPVIASGVEYYYSNGSFYRRFGDAYLAAPAPIGAVVRTIPRDYKPIVIDGANYYIIHGSVYMQIPSGYQVMPQKPFMIEKAAADQKDMMSIPPQTTLSSQQPNATDEENTFTINISNSKGGYTPVIIKKSGDGFVGPQGEQYQEFPKVEQLKTKYAK